MVTISDLPGLVGKVLVVQVQIKDSDDEDFREVRGRCLIANKGGMVIQTKSRSEMIQVSDVIDIEVERKDRRLMRRWIGEISADAVRQHLLDRHGVPFEVVKAMDTESAVLVHEKIDHTKLGHEHGEKPTRGYNGKKERTHEV